jgi:small conductance mechanosensitive channel
VNWPNNWQLPITVEQMWTDYLLPWGGHLLTAIAIFYIGRMIVGVVGNTVSRMLSRTSLDPILGSFLLTLINTALMALILVAALSQLGLDTTSLVALVGAAGLAIGLALKDSLSHFAAGVMLILFRPFRVGDYVEVDSVAGSVDRITIFSTRLKTPDNRVVTIPNGNVFGNTMVNYSEEKTRRIDLVIGISYGSNLLKAKQILIDLVEGHPLILKDPEYRVAVSELADSSVNFVVRPWVKSEDYWTVRFELMETIKLTFDKEGIEIPFPQLSIHMDKAE